MSHVLHWISLLAERHAGKVVIFFLLSMIPALMLASRLELRENFGDLLPEDTLAVKDLNFVAERAGGAAFIVTAVDASDVERAKRFAHDLEERALELDCVRFVESRLDVDFVKERQLLYLSPEDLEELVDETAHRIDKKLAGSTGIFVDLEEEGPSGTASTGVSLEEISDRLEGKNLPLNEYAIGKDGKYLYVFIRLTGTTGDLSFGRQAWEKIQSVVDALRDGTRYPKDLEVRCTGSVVVRLEDNAFVQADLRNAGILGFLLVVLIITIYTRYPRLLVLVSLPLLVGVSWTFAFGALAIGHINLITGFLTAILFGLGIDFSVHMFLRYVEDRRKGEAAEVAMESALKQTGRAVFAGAITTAAAFFVVRFADFKGYTEFGLLASFGILMMLFSSLLLFPALTELFERWRSMDIRPVNEMFMSGLVVPRWLRLSIVLGTLAFALFSFFELSAGNVKFKTNWRELKGESPASDFDDYMVESLGGSFSLTAVLLEHPGQSPVVEEVVKRTREERLAAGKTSGIQRTLSMHDLVPPDQELRLEQIAELRKQLLRVKPETLEGKELEVWQDAVAKTEVQAFTEDDVPQSLKNRFQTVDGKGTLMLFFSDYEFYELDELLAWAEEVETVRTRLIERGVEARVMSENWIVGTVFGVMLGDGPYIMWSAFFAIFIVLLIDFRSLRRALIVITPLVLGVMCIGGGMYILGIELNFMNGVVIPCMVGIGIDNAIHVYHRYLEEGPGSAPVVLRHSASATMLASFTTMMGFGAMIIAHHRGIRSVAELALLGITTTYICTSVAFPLAIETFEEIRDALRRRRAKA